MNDVPFTSVVGQDIAKAKLGFYLNSYMKTRMVPNLMMVAPKGCGKTTMAREVAKCLVRFNEVGAPEINAETGRPRRKMFVEVNCSTIKGIKAFINGLIIPQVVDKDVTILFDEASELPKDVTMALLTMLNPCPTNRNTFVYDEYSCDIDFRHQTFIFATSEPQSVFHALLDRLERIDLEEYTPVHLAEIVRRNNPNILYEDGVLHEVATVLRGNARAAQKMATNIAMYLGDSNIFMHEDWAKLCSSLGILPLGVSQIELAVLRYLAQAPDGTSLTCLSAKTGLSRSSLQKDVEMFLQKLGMVEIATTGRKITARGLDYLKRLDASALLPVRI